MTMNNTLKSEGLVRFLKTVLSEVQMYHNQISFRETEALSWAQFILVGRKQIDLDSNPNSANQQGI